MPFFMERKAERHGIKRADRRLRTDPWAVLVRTEQRASVFRSSDSLRYGGVSTAGAQYGGGPRIANPPRIANTADIDEN